MNEEKEPDNEEKAIRIGCGAVFGLGVGFYLSIHLANILLGFWPAFIAASVIVFAFLALRYGDEFWMAVLDSWRRW